MKRTLSTFTLTLAMACGGNTNTYPPAHDAAIDAGPTIDAPPDASCFTNPQTNDEIINACTTAQKIFKTSHPPLLNPDGTLPPLPL
jgi:hypothetical protein